MAATTGITVEELTQAAELLALNKPMAVIWAMGITQHTTGVINVLSLGNLQMLLGNMGIAGGGVNPLRGQNNVQGACDMGALPNVFPGYQNVIDAQVRAKFAAAWQLESNGAPARLFGDAPGLCQHGDDSRASKAERCARLYIIGEDPLMTDPDLNDVRECFEDCEFTVLQEIFPSETAAYADVLLPAASFVETGRHLYEHRAAHSARACGFHPGGRGPARLAGVFRRGQEDAGAGRPGRRRTLCRMGVCLAGRNHGRDCRAHAVLCRGQFRAARPRRATVLAGQPADHPGTPILHIGQFTRGKGKFHAIDHLPPQELPDAEYPLLLTTGRVIYHWHGGEMTRRAKGLLEIYPESLVEIHPEDALKIALNGNRRIKVSSRRGEMIAQALVTDRVSPGIIFGNFHFPGAQNINNVTIFALDPVAKIPEYKVCAVKISPAADVHDRRAPAFTSA